MLAELAPAGFGDLPSAAVDVATEWQGGIDIAVGSMCRITCVRCERAKVIDAGSDAIKM